MKVILIGHKARQGKDTYAEMLQGSLEKYGKRASIFNFAAPLKEILSETLGISRPTLDALKNENEHYRAILQRFGSGKMKDYFGEDVWKRLAMKHISELEAMGIEYVIIPDFRFPEEYIDGAVTIKVTRPGVSVGDGHISETAINNYDFDHTVVNDLDLDYLQLESMKMAQKIVGE